MMELIPIHVEEAIVLNSSTPCKNSGTNCRVCPEIAVILHNWLLARELQYVIIDFQDEKEVCQTVLIELLQLRKRLDIPFLFIGLMDKSKELMLANAYSGAPFFSTPEEAVAWLFKAYPSLPLKGSQVEFNHPILNLAAKSRLKEESDDDSTDDDQDE